MKPVILLLAATALVGAAPPRPAPPYEAGGFEPSWDLRIDRGRLIYDSGTGAPVINIPLPRRQAVRNGYRYVSRHLTVDVRHVRCESYNGRTFADTVRPSLAVEAGCGGRAIAPPTLAQSGWDIESVAGLRTPGDHEGYRFEFMEGRLSVRLRCRDYSSTFFRERRPVLQVGPLSSTRNTCPATALERRLLAIMRGPVRISWVDGDTLVLTGRGGSIRLLPS
jgi:heat shock protein HslJ